MTVTCNACGHRIHEGESAWAEDWKVVDCCGVRTETRYTCDECATA